MKYLFFGLIAFLLTSCSDWDTRLVLVNKTNNAIRFVEEMKAKDNYLPDTTYCKTDDPYNVLPNSERIVRSHNKWEHSFKRPGNEFLRIYIINEDSLKKYGACVIFKQQIFMKRYDLTYDELQKMNWRVEFK